MKASRSIVKLEADLKAHVDSYDHQLNLPYWSSPKYLKVMECLIKLTPRPTISDSMAYVLKTLGSKIIIISAETITDDKIKMIDVKFEYLGGSGDSYIMSCWYQYDEITESHYIYGEY